MDISEVTRATGLPASAIRYYEAQALIQSQGRKGLKRVFGKGIVERLALIALGRSAGFSLNELRALLSAEKDQLDRNLLSAKADALDAHIRKLCFIRDHLRHAAVCPATTHLQCPNFRRLLRMAVQQQKAAKRRQRKEKSRADT